MPSDVRLAVVGAHAFDAEAMAGGLAARVAAEGGRVTLIHLTRGERGDPSKTPEAYAAQLEGEMREAAAALGAEARWMGYPAGALPDDGAAAADLGRALEDLRPDLVVTHWQGSWHPRHVAAHRITLEAVRRLRGPRPAVYFGENCEDLAGFAPVLYVDVSAAYPVWLEALRRYEMFRRSEAAGYDGIPYAVFYPAMARARGLEAACAHAQAFMPARALAPGGDPFSMRPGQIMVASALRAR